MPRPSHVMLMGFSKIHVRISKPRMRDASIVYAETDSLSPYDRC